MLSTSENREALVRPEHELMWRTAVHEAAHCVCANWFSPPIPIIRATVERRPIPQVTTGKYPRHEMSGWCGALLTWSAVAAEQFLCGPPIPDLVISSHRDRVQHFLTVGGFRTDREVIECLHRQAAWFVRTPWAQRGIHAVANALIERGTLDGAEIRSLCGDPHDTVAADWRVHPDPRLQ
jgi:hypothetical protein